MKVNGIPVKKYKAKVRNIIAFTTLPEKVNTDEYKIVEGYVSISSVVVHHEDFRKPPRLEFKPVFITEEINFGATAGSGMGITVYAQTVYNDFELIGEVEDKIESGQLVELPCKVGDTVYLPCLADCGDLEHYTIKTVGFDKSGFFFIVDDEDGERHYLDEIGKDCFLIEAQAEVRLKELKGEL